MISPRNWYAKLTGDEVPTKIRGVVKFLSHWLFQGIPRMDKYERTFKIACTTIFTGAFYVAGIGWTGSLFTGHTANFILNSNLVAALKPFRISRYKDREAFDEYTLKIVRSFSKCDWVKEVYVAGSVNREDWHPGSDLDVLVVREPGFWNGTRAVFRGMITRATATFNLFPLDMYIFSEDTLDERQLQEDLVPYEAISSG